MKRFLFVILLAFTFFLSSCEYLKKEHWIAMQIYQDNKLLNILYDKNVDINYINIELSKPIEVKYFLIPDCDEHIAITDIEYDSNKLVVTSLKEPIITFKAIQTGKTYIHIKTKAHHSTSSLELRIIDE